jgi:hypothetical protein
VTEAQNFLQKLGDAEERMYHEVLDVLLTTKTLDKS